MSGAKINNTVDYDFIKPTKSIRKFKKTIYQKAVHKITVEEDNVK
jgi:hypothetical protein